MFLTKLAWLDRAVALLFALLIVFTGYRIVRDSLKGNMDEADEQLLAKMVELLQEKRVNNWIDLHNTRIIKYGSTLHLDCHLTVSWYLNVHEAHAEVDRFSRLVNDNFGGSIELSVHTDGCPDFSREIGRKQDCPERKAPFRRSVEWCVRNISDNRKLKLSENA